MLPSLLAADFGNLEREVRAVEEVGVRGVHLDVMDGCFVPNLTFGLPILAALRRVTKLLIDTHLMICQPERYIERFVTAGADCVTVHIEAVENPRDVLRQIRELGVAAGIALNPDTDVSTIAQCLDLCDLVLVMSVPAGFGGQPFHEVALDKLAQIRTLANNRVLLEVDGGINAATIGRCARAGAGLFVAGSAVFGSPDYGEAIRRLDRLAAIS